MNLLKFIYAKHTFHNEPVKIHLHKTYTIL